VGKGLALPIPLANSMLPHPCRLEGLRVNFKTEEDFLLGFHPYAANGDDFSIIGSPFHWASYIPYAGVGLRPNVTYGCAKRELPSKVSSSSGSSSSSSSGASKPARGDWFTVYASRPILAREELCLPRACDDGDAANEKTAKLRVAIFECLAQLMAAGLDNGKVAAELRKRFEMSVPLDVARWAPLRDVLAPAVKKKT
jgi:hypothetical protein